MSNSNTASKGTALITGASTGIGAVYADRLAKRGYDLVLIARNGKLLNELASSLTSSTGRKVEALPADLTNKDELLKVEQRLRTDSSITALVNNAGFGGVSTLLDSSVDGRSQNEPDGDQEHCWYHEQDVRLPYGGSA